MTKFNISPYQSPQDLQQTLEQNNFVFPLALRWCTDDIDIINESLDEKLRLTDEQKIEILNKFFARHERDIIEMINDRLCEFIHYGEYEE